MILDTCVLLNTPILVQVEGKDIPENESWNRKPL